MNKKSISYQNNVVDGREVRSVDQEEGQNMVEVCCVFGEKTLSNNFGVIACESCKDFFRRTIQRTKVGTAPVKAQKRRRRSLSDDAVNYEELDSDNAENMASTVPCRCQLGTAEDTESASVAVYLSEKLQEKIGEHSARGVQMLVQAAFNAAAPDDPTENVSSDYAAAVKTDAQTGSSLEQERIGWNALQRKRPADDCVDQQSKHQATNNKHQQTSFGIEYEDLATIEFPSFLPTGMKYVKLEELLLASENMRYWKSGFPPLQGVTLETYTMTDLYNMVYFSHAYATNQHRRLSSLKRLCSDDKAALLGVRVAEVVLVHLSIKHNMTTGKTEIGYPGTPKENMELAKRVQGDFAKETTKFKYSFPDNFRRNESIYVILCALALFNSDQVQLQDKDVVNAERQMYLELLKEYLKSTFGTWEGRWAYRSLISWLNGLSLWAHAQKLHSVYEIDPLNLDVCKVTLDGWVH